MTSATDAGERAPAPPAPTTRSEPGLGAALARPHLPALDGLRAVAVSIVIVGHFGDRAPGDLGVSAFFVLSGFLITWLLMKEVAASGSVDLKRFFVARTLRIFPAYYAFLAVSIGLDLLRGDSRIRPVIVPALLYGVNYYNAVGGHAVNSVSHAWSLAIEEQFYLVWPLLFLGLARFGRRVLVGGLVAMIVAVLAWRSVAYLALDLGAAYVYNAFDTRFDSLAVGCLLAAVISSPALSRFARAISAAAWMPLVTLAVLLASRLLTPNAYRYGPGFTVDALLVAVLIVQLLSLHASGAWRWLDHRTVVFIGAISYPLYLYHQLGLGAGKRIGAFLPTSGQLVLGVCLSLAVAAGSYYVIERPFLRLKKRLATRSAGGGPAAGREAGPPPTIVLRPLWARLRLARVTSRAS